MRVAIVDDEELARMVLREMLRREPGVEIAAECANGFEAVRAVHELALDVMLLDIQMPKLDGFEVLELLQAGGAGTAPAVVFVTAHDEYALRAFEVHAVDYLLKPFTAERLHTALARARERRSPDARALAASAHPGPVERIVVRDGPKVTIIPIAKLDYAEAQDDYVALATEGKKHLKQQTIASLEASLDPRQFVRIHRSYLARVDRIVRIEPAGSDSQIAILHSGERLPVSRNGAVRLKQVLG
ncbi:MAG TPA: response regulator [Terriglobales bacterium]|jgi:two-component system LytT family response regulator